MYLCIMSFSERLRSRMEALGIKSQHELASLTNGKVSVATINSYLSGESQPNIDRLQALAQALKTTGAYFIEEVDDPSPDALKAITEDEAAMLGHRARGKEWDDLLPADDMALDLQELAILRRIRLRKEAERQKGSTDTPRSKPEP